MSLGPAFLCVCGSSHLVRIRRLPAASGLRPMPPSPGGKRVLFSCRSCTPKSQAGATGLQDSGLHTLSFCEVALLATGSPACPSLACLWHVGHFSRRAKFYWSGMRDEAGAQHRRPAVGPRVPAAWLRFTDVSSRATLAPRPSCQPVSPGVTRNDSCWCSFTSVSLGSSRLGSYSYPGCACKTQDRCHPA